MRKLLIGVLGGLLVSAVSGSSAYGATYAVSVAGATSSGAHTFFGTSTPGGLDFSILNNSATEVALGCGSLNVEGEVHSGSFDLDASPIATIKAVSRSNTPDAFARSQWKSCVAMLGLSLTIVPLNDWEIWMPGPTIMAVNGDVISGYLTGPAGGSLRAQAYATAGGPAGTACNFTFSGAALASFNEASQHLVISETLADGNLSLDTVLGNCLGLVQVGNPMSLEASLNLGPDVVGNDKDTTKDDWTPFPIYIS